MEDLASKENPDLSIVIPTWNGIDLLRRNLPSVLEAQRRLLMDCDLSSELIIVDDASTDETVDRVPLEFPSARLVCRAKNGGFSKACNSGFGVCRAAVIALLNNDVQVEPEYFIHQYTHFHDPNVFAVTAKVFEGGPPIFSAGGRFSRFRRGFWSVYFNYDIYGAEAGEWTGQHDLLSLYAIGGFATYDRQKLEELGGFNELLSPFHWEDVDLSYRGWKRGWEIHYEPRSRATHEISATIDAHYHREHVEKVSFRNRLLFHWINLHSPWYLVQHLLMLCLFSITRVFVLDFSFYRSFYGALKLFPAVIHLRAKEKRLCKRTDVQVHDLLQDFYNTAPIKVFRSEQEIIQFHNKNGESDTH